MNALDHIGDLRFKLVLFIILIEFRIHLHHVGQGPASFREVEHLPLDFGKRDAIVTRLSNDSGDEVLHCLANSWELLHGREYISHAQLRACLSLSRPSDTAALFHPGSACNHLLCMRTVITAARLWDGAGFLDRPCIVVEDCRIASIGSAAAGGALCGVQALSFPEATLAPAYFDVHFHGSAGHDVMEATPEALGTIGRFLAARGTGRYLATTVTAPVDATLRALEGLAKWIQGMPGEDARGARMIGIHLEGPFLSHQRRGVQPLEFLLEPDIALFDRFFEAAEGHVRLMTLAPELPGAIDLARHAIVRGVRISVGHSNATAAETRAAVDTGAASATHTFNAMRPFDHREPGVLGVALSEDKLYAELICDGIHTSHEAVKLWWRAKGPARAILVTDAMSAAGMPDGIYRLGGMDVDVQAGKATHDGVLAGSALTLDLGLANLVAFTGAPLEQALAAATVNPAAMLGLGLGNALAPGELADMAVLDGAGRLTASVMGGALVTA